MIKDSYLMVEPISSGAQGNVPFMTVAVATSPSGPELNNALMTLKVSKMKC